MGQPQPVSPFTAQDYLAWEVEQEGKHEYYYGEVFAMGGASRRHVTVALNVAADLNEQLAGSPCRAYMADMMAEAVSGEGVWTLRDVPIGERLVLAGLGLEIEWWRIFRNVEE